MAHLYLKTKFLVNPNKSETINPHVNRDKIATLTFHKHLSGQVMQLPFGGYPCHIAHQPIRKKIPFGFP